MLSIKVQYMRFRSLLIIPEGSLFESPPGIYGRIVASNILPGRVAIGLSFESLCMSMKDVSCFYLAELHQTRRDKYNKC